MHLRKMISTFHKDHPKKPTATSPPLNSAPPMAKLSVKPSVKPFTKQKWGHPISSTKQAKEWDIGQWDFSFPVLVRLKDFFTNPVSFGRDAHSASFSNSAGALSMNSTLPLSALSINSTLLLGILSMSGIPPPIFRLSSSVSHWVKRFFIRLIPRFSFSVSHWVRRFFIYQKKLYPCTLTRSAELAS